MYFNKFPHIENFKYAAAAGRNGTVKIGRENVRITVRPLRDGIFHIRPVCRRWPRNLSQAGLKPPAADRSSRSGYSMELHTQFGFTLRDPGGAPLLTTPAGRTFGLCGERSIFVFEQSPDMRFYGMGEKMRGFELSGIQTKFWNTDIFADFHWDQISNDRPDPMYASIPYVIIKRGNTFIGILLDNPHATFMSCSENAGIGGGQMIISSEKKKYLTIGAQNGMPELYIIVGPSLAALTRKLQQLVGVTPLPPAWALGYHQCRWGYKSETCLKQLDENFTRHGIPCDGLWVDIDYMDSFKVFSFNKDYFPSPDRTIRKLARKGRKVVPIIDPGVKKEKGYPVYESGRKAGAFCKNPEGDDFVGLVWPGETVFPDFSMPAARKWWAAWVAKFAGNGFEGCWIDMNDPSTGPVLNEDMLFNQGRHAHHAYHNQYANGMAMATREGFAKANPNIRPFVLSRSGYTGISRYSALWTGDNMSSYHYLRNCIAVSMNLALSGVPFNGPDIGGFAGNASAQLMTDWMKTCFLFPFCRNHSMHGQRDQEPWAFEGGTLEILKHFIQTRYLLRPYLYNLFIQQEETGEAILRPLFYDFEDSADFPLTYIDDAFMIGPSILQAPILNEHERTREAPLPGTNAWFSVLDNGWVPGGQRRTVTPGDKQTAFYLRESSIIPSAPELPETNRFNSREVAFHVLLKKDSKEPARYIYCADDGQTLDYRKGKRTRLNVEASVDGGVLDIRTSYEEKGYGVCRCSFVVYDSFEKITLNGRAVTPRQKSMTLAGSDVTVWTC